MTDYDSVDFFTDQSLLEDPYPYFDHLRSKCPVVPTAHHGVVAVSGYEEAMEVYLDTETFSSCNSVIGPFAAFPVPLEGDDVGAIIDSYRDQLPMNEHMVTMDPPMHTRERALVMRLLTPKRLKENEAFMWGLADRQIDEFVGAGRCEFISAYSQPFAMLAVADVLGVPEADHERFRQFFGLSASPGKLGGNPDIGLNALGGLDDWFATYIEDRRREPRDDVLTRLAQGTYPDGSTPDVTSVVRTATFLFAAGQETTARLLAVGLKYLAENPELQDELRAHSERIPDFVDEALRIESPVKADFRLSPARDERRRRRCRRRHTCDAPERRGQPRPPAIRRARRVPARPFERQGPHRLRAWRPFVPRRPIGPRRRVGSASSASSTACGTSGCPRSTMGPPEARHFEYEPTWVLRGLHKLYIEFTPAEVTR